MMTLFFAGSLQEGIALAVQEAKAVVCFARDESELSSNWEEGYFSDAEITQALHDKAITLRLTSGSQEAGFLTSFCPIKNYPTVVVIKNGTLQEFITPDVSKEDFLSRLKVALEGKYAPPPVAQQPQPSTPSTSNVPATSSTSPTAVSAPPTNISTQHAASQVTPGSSQTGTQRQAGRTSPSKRSIPKEDKPEKPKPKQEKPKQVPELPSSSKSTTTTTTKNTKKPKEEPKPHPPVPRGPPKEYRLQVRLFDGSSVRSTFMPRHTISNEVRSWLDQQMTEDNRPYNLKHILTPLPSRTLSMVEESQALEELGLGSTANLVMVPVQSFTSAYSTAGSSLPVRGISAVYNMASSVASTATSFVGSFIGYGQTPQPSEPESSTTSSTPPAGTRNRPTSGPNIRTLHDQRNDGRDSQLYNGNQLNFEPRNQDRGD